MFLNKPFFFTMASKELMLSVNMSSVGKTMNKTMNFFVTCCHIPYKIFVKELLGTEGKFWFKAPSNKEHSIFSTLS